MTNVLGTSFFDRWVLRTNIDGMVHFDPARGFDTVNDAVQGRTHSQAIPKDAGSTASAGADRTG